MSHDTQKDFPRVETAYGHSQEIRQLTTYFDQLIRKKQLPLRQQTNQPFKYSSPIPESSLFSQDVLLSKREFPSFGWNGRRSSYSSGHSQTRSYGQDFFLQPLQEHDNHIQEVSSLSNKPYTRPASATDIAARVMRNKATNLSSTAVVSGLPEMSSMMAQPEIIHRNSFLKPTVSRGTKSVSNYLGNSSFVSNTEPYNAPHQRSANGFTSVNSLKLYSGRTLVKPMSEPSIQMSVHHYGSLEMSQRSCLVSPTVSFMPLPGTGDIHSLSTNRGEALARQADTKQHSGNFSIQVGSLTSDEAESNRKSSANLNADPTSSSLISRKESVEISDNSSPIDVNESCTPHKKDLKQTYHVSSKSGFTLANMNSSAVDNWKTYADIENKKHANQNCGQTPTLPGPHATYFRSSSNVESNNSQCSADMRRSQTSLKLDQSISKTQAPVQSFSLNQTQCRAHKLSAFDFGMKAISQTPTVMAVSQTPTVMAVSQKPTVMALSQTPTVMAVSQKPTVMTVSQTAPVMAVSQTPPVMAVSHKPKVMAISQTPTVMAVSQTPTVTAVSQIPTLMNISQTPRMTEVSQTTQKDSKVALAQTLSIDAQTFLATPTQSVAPKPSKLALTPIKEARPPFQASSEHIHQPTPVVVTEASLISGSTPETMSVAGGQTPLVSEQTPSPIPGSASPSLDERNITPAQKSVTSFTERRSHGDGAPSEATKKLTEKHKLVAEHGMATVDCDSEEADENDDDSNGSLAEEENKIECRRTHFKIADRQPADGENTEDDMESLDGSLSDNGSNDSSLKSSYLEESTRPLTFDLSHINKLESKKIDSGKDQLRRPSTNDKPVVTQPAFRYSLFHRIPPTINFVAEGERAEPIPYELSRLMKWKMSPITPVIVKTALARLGFKITKKNHDWLGCFGKHMKATCFKTMHEFQKLNHFPGSFQIGRKDKLWRSLNKMQLHHGRQEFNFIPQTFILPQDINLLKQTWDEAGTARQKWIIKPPASARGIGIRVVSKWSQIPKKKPLVVQKYIHRPFLINRSKFDMRVYVYVSCYDPLRLYVYEDGLARFASCKYSSSSKSLQNKFIHLTNYSINKKNTDYLNNDDDCVSQGHKWSLKALWSYLTKQGINANLIWETIRDLIIKTIISGDSMINSMTKSNTASRYCCHELFGFDILLDENLKPWILEVNISPSLHSNSNLDKSIKGAMIKDMMNLAGFRLPDEREICASSLELDKDFPSNPYCMDKRLFTNQLAPDERAKHAFYCQKYNDELASLALIGASKVIWSNKILSTMCLKRHMQALSSILSVLTPDDVRLLCESIDEDSRKGNFQRLFPTPSTHRYLRFFEQPRYYNLLLDQWVLQYNHREQQGITLLDSLCQKGLHLQNPTSDLQHKWVVAASLSSSMYRTPELRPVQTGSRDSNLLLPEPRQATKNQHQLGHLSLSSGSSNSLSPVCPL